MGQDVRLAVRGVWKARGFAIASVLTLAIGIGGTPLVFCIVDTLIVRPRPFGDRSERLITLHSTHPTQAQDWDDSEISYPDLRDLRDLATSLEAVEGLIERSVSLAGTDESERVLAASITPGLFRLLGVEAAIGPTTGAAPIWNAFMQFAIPRLTNNNPLPFQRPNGIIDKAVCALSGAEPSEWCPDQRLELFAQDQPPLPKDKDLWQRVWVDSFSLELASDACRDYAIERVGLAVTDAWAQKWLKDDSQGKTFLEDKLGVKEDERFFIPTDICDADTPHPVVAFTAPAGGSVITSAPLTIFGRASAGSAFKDWVLEYGVGSDPDHWPDLAIGKSPLENPGELFVWDLAGVPNGPITLRLTVRGENNGKAGAELRLTLNLPTPTPTQQTLLTTTTHIHGQV